MHANGDVPPLAAKCRARAIVCPFSRNLPMRCREPDCRRTVHRHERLLQDDTALKLRTFAPLINSRCRKPPPPRAVSWYPLQLLPRQSSLTEILTGGYQHHCCGRRAPEGASLRTTSARNSHTSLQMHVSGAMKKLRVQLPRHPSAIVGTRQIGRAGAGPNQLRKSSTTEPADSDTIP